MTTQNEAAERLRALERSGVPLSEDEQHHAEGDCELCAAERRATVERIRERLLNDEVLRSNLLVRDRIALRLDEEAAR